MTKKIKPNDKCRRKQNNKIAKKKILPKDCREIIRRTRSSNTKEDGYYKFENMMSLYIKLQSETQRKVTARSTRDKYRVKSGRSRK